MSDKFPKWTPEKIFEKTGIKERGKSAINETACDLAILASEKLFSKSEIDKNNIDTLIFVTQTPNQCLPSTSCEIHSFLGLSKNCGTFDVNQGCSGYIYGLFLANSLIESGSAKYVLLLTGDTYTKIIDPEDSSAMPLFGDGASASIIGPDFESSLNKSIGRFEFGTDGSKSSFLNCDFGGFRKMPSKWNSLYMNGPGVMTFTLDVIPKAINNFLENQGLNNNDIDLIFLHQANKFILERIYKKTNFLDRGVICLENFGNTVSSSIPIALANKINFGEKYKTNIKSKILLVGFGVGLSWGTTLLTI